MINPNGSNVPKARELLGHIVTDMEHLHMYGFAARINNAIALMRRQRALRRADTQQRVQITPTMKATAIALSADPSLSNADIAEKIGLPKCASGRVTEILQGLR